MKRRILFVAAAIFLAANLFFAQNTGTLDWEITYGGPGNQMAIDMILNTSGNYVMAGYTDAEGAGSYDFWITEVDQYGVLTGFSYTYGGLDNDRANAIKQTIDGGYILAGYSASYSSPQSNYDMYVVKTFSNGTQEWANSYGEGTLKWVSLTSTGYIVAGTNLIKLNSSGGEIWRVNEGFTCVQTITNEIGQEEYIALGNGEFPINLILKKFDVNGNELWAKEYFGANMDFAEEVIQTSDEGFMITSTSSSNSGSVYLDMWLIKTDSEGNEQWSEFYGGFYHDECHGVKETSDGGYILSGIKQVIDQFDNDIWVVKIDAQGSIQWEWLAALPENNWAQAVVQNSNGGYAVAGMSRNNDLADEDLTLLQFEPDPLTAWFTANQTYISPGEVVKFSDGTLGSPATSWAWDLDGDVNTIESTDQNPSYNYNDPGNYDITLTINNGLSSFTRAAYIIVSSQPPVEYCDAWGNASLNWIKSVSLNGQGNSSSNVGYEDFTSIIFNLESNYTYEIVLDPGAAPGKKVPKNWRVWIDFNQDSDFYDANEEVFSIDGEKGGVSGSIYIPESFVGSTRMRVVVNADDTPVPCEDGGFSGEVEDYTINVSPPIPQPPVADFQADVTSVSIGDPVSFTDLSTNGPILTYEWSFDPGTVSYEASTTQHSPNPIVVFNNNGYYTIQLTVTNSIGSDVEIKTDYIYVTDDPTSWCEPVNISNSLSACIREVVINNWNNLTYMNQNGYTYFPALDPIEFAVGETHQVTLVPGDNRSRNFWRLWIDYNRDGDFADDGEEIIKANNKKGNIEESILVPNDPTLLTQEPTRMRVSLKQGGAQTGPCDDNFTGEVEDYNVVFISLKDLGSSGKLVHKLDASLYPNPVTDDRLTLELRNISATASIEVFNKYGAVVDRMETASSKINLNVSGYAAGIYFVKVMHAGEMKVMKFVK